MHSNKCFKGYNIVVLIFDHISFMVCIVCLYIITNTMLFITKRELMLIAQNVSKT